MMRKYLFYFLISCLFLGCSTPEKKAEIIMKQFTSSLHDIGDVTNMSAKELSEKIRECKKEVDKKISVQRKEYTKQEEKERFDNAISLNDIEIYLKLRQELTNKNLKSLEHIKGKKWINSKSESASSIFSIDENCISFLNLKNKFTYALEDGEIIFDNDGGMNPLYFTIEGSDLIITNGQGQSNRFREAIFEDIVQGKWISSNISAFGFILKKDGKGISFGVGRENITYTLKDKNVTIVEKKKFRADDIEHYKYLSNDRLLATAYGIPYLRKQEAGPDCLTFLFDEKVKSDAKVKTTFSTSNSNNNWDSVLDDYEEFVDKYIKLLKKAQSGDTSAITEYAECLEKAESLQAKLENAKSELTRNQISRLTRIISKLSNAVASAF